MVRFLTVPFVLLAVLLLVACESTAVVGRQPSLTPRPPAGDTYLTLGDSVAAGSGASTAAKSYAEVLYRELSGADSTLTRHVNLAVPGETSESFIEEQLPKALDELASGRVRLATFAIGANDLLRLLRRCGVRLKSEECQQIADEALDELEKNVATALEELQEAAPGTRIVMLDYYNPLANLLPGTQPFADRLNKILRDASADANLELVEIAPIFQDHEAGLTRILRGDVHPNDEGHRLIAEALARAIEGSSRRLVPVA